jgi:hypothetical protein
MKELEDPLLSELGALPVRPIDDLTGERVRRRAQELLDGERRRAARPWMRVAVPAVLASAVAVYLWWAFSFTAALYG